ncbi:MAG: hypothetical protein NC819_03370 [Candidatus Omnitrophica bacterium]|nr:hypothetical protein [Candidatus Omnitrophota bacterium]
MKRHLRVAAVLAVTAFVLTGTGCSHDWKKKFVRKRKKEIKAAQPILTYQSDQEAAGPASVRYRQRFAFWKSWHTDLVRSYGESQKRDIRYLNGTIGELGSMAGILEEGPAAQRLREILAELNELKGRWESREGAWSPPLNEKIRLEQLQREIERELRYAKVKQWLPESPAPEKQVEKIVEKDGTFVSGTTSP